MLTTAEETRLIWEILLGVVTVGAKPKNFFQNRVRSLHRRTGRHFTGGAEKICPESNFFSLIRMGPETSCKSVLYS